MVDTIQWSTLINPSLSIQAINIAKKDIENAFFFKA